MLECDEGYYGVGCKQICGYCTEISHCDHATGHCTEGCKDWFQGITCHRGRIQETVTFYYFEK